MPVTRSRPRRACAVASSVLQRSHSVIIIRTDGGDFNRYRRRKRYVRVQYIRMLLCFRSRYRLKTHYIGPRRDNRVFSISVYTMFGLFSFLAVDTTTAATNFECIFYDTNVTYRYDDRQRVRRMYTTHECHIFISDCMNECAYDDVRMGGGKVLRTKPGKSMFRRGVGVKEFEKFRIFDFYAESFCTFAFVSFERLPIPPQHASLSRTLVRFRPPRLFSRGFFHFPSTVYAFTRVYDVRKNRFVQRTGCASHYTRAYTR